MLANYVVNRIENMAEKPVIVLARVAIWLSAAVTLAVAVTAAYLMFSDFKDNAGIAIQAVQALGVLAITVLGWYGYRGGSSLLAKFLRRRKRK